MVSAEVSDEVCISELFDSVVGLSEVSVGIVGALKLKLFLPPPVLMLPMTLRLIAEASTSASLSRCADSVDGMVPSSCPWMDSPRSFTTW